jgi:hypothetical protein
MMVGHCGNPPRYRGFDPDGVANNEADYFEKCPGCGEWFDLRDMAQMAKHIHGEEIEAGEGPEPPREGPAH